MWSRSNKTEVSRRKQSQGLRGLVVRVLAGPWAQCGLVALAALGVALSRSRVAEVHATIGASKERLDVPLWLSPEHAEVFSLGYREALADGLFASALVEYGLTFQEPRRFSLGPIYLDTITQLAPRFDRPYLYADALLTLQAEPATADDFRATLRLHERGLAALPLHTELWSVAGQFAVYLAPQRLPPEERAAVRLRGAQVLARACELVSANDNIPYHCISAANIFSKQGQRDAMIRMLERTLAVNDDPKIRARALAFLASAAGEREREEQARRLERLEARWRRDAPHASRALLSLLGPRVSLPDCAGVLLPSPACVTDWRGWDAAQAEGTVPIRP